MRRVLIVLPNLLGQPGEATPLQGALPNLEILAEAGTVTKIAPLPDVETPEALYLGMAPDQGQLRQGPLTVAALGQDPPDRSTHFHLSLASLHDGILSFPQIGAHPAALVRMLPRLNTRTLTLLPGIRTDHALVWEGLGDLSTVSPPRAGGRPIRDCLPEGDNEPALRRLIDDSVNLLAESDENRIREEEGLPPLNILWPWGHGTCVPVPNLWLERGERALVMGA
ncbi:MAG TPA: hypothetical protein VGE01_02015, partial [Fimbriimonas sp.]